MANQMSLNAAQPLQRQGNWFSGYPASVQQLAKFSPGQQNIMNSLGQLGAQGVQNYNPSFAPIAQQARTNFGQTTIPGIAERFSALGAQGSSAFGQQLGQAGAGLEQGLAGLESQHNLQQQGLFQNLLGLGLQPQNENILLPSAEGFGSKAAGEVVPGILKLLLAYFGGA